MSVTKHRPGPCAIAANSVIFLTDAVWITGVFIATASGDTGAVVEAASHAEVRLVDGAAVVALDGEPGGEEKVRHCFPTPVDGVFMSATYHV